MIFILKIFIRAALWLFCSDININNKHLLKIKGPLLIIANHPNSFLDAIIIGVQYKRRVHFLARGDAFTKKHHRFLLGLLNIIPVHRQKEGKQYLHLNDFTFQEAVRLLNKGEAVLIFIEGICLNTHELQPFKKGTTRILEEAHKKGINPIIHIAGIAYNHFRGIGKKVNISIVDLMLTRPIISPKDRVEFNKNAFAILNKNIFPPLPTTVIKKTPFYYLHLPYYRLIQKVTHKKTNKTVFYDSVLFSLLLFTYPLFIIVLYLALYFIGIPQSIIFGTLLCIPILSKYTTI